MSKRATLLLITALAVSSLIAANLALASVTYTTPSVPEFTLKLADHSYDVLERTTSTFDPYTGKTTTQTLPAYHVQNLTIDIIFRNQNFPSTINGYSTVLYYDIAIKPHFTQDWDGPYDKGWFPAQMNSEYTTISFPLSDYPDEGQVDFRAQVYLGYHYSYVDYSHIQPIPQSSFASSASDWSDTQTITISKSQAPAPSPATTSTPDPTPEQTQLPAPIQEPQQTEPIAPIVGIPIIAVVVGAGLGLLVYFKKRKR